MSVVSFFLSCCGVSSSAQWTKRQRYQYKLLQDGKHSTLTEDRMSALNRLGFVWQSHNAVWMERYNDLIAFRAKHGHCKVPTKYPANPQLAVWVKCQRRQFKLFFQGQRSHMTVQRAKMLAKADFVFNPRNLKDGAELTKQQVLMLEAMNAQQQQHQHMM